MLLILCQVIQVASLFNTWLVESAELVTYFYLFEFGHG
jgi:hypothetical protein